jgi:hypothetical protein
MIKLVIQRRRKAESGGGSKKRKFGGDQQDDDDDDSNDLEELVAANANSVRSNRYAVHCLPTHLRSI